MRKPSVSYLGFRTPVNKLILENVINEINAELMGKSIRLEPKQEPVTEEVLAAVKYFSCKQIAEYKLLASFLLACHRGLWSGEVHHTGALLLIDCGEADLETDLSKFVEQLLQYNSGALNKYQIADSVAQHVARVRETSLRPRFHSLGFADESTWDDFTKQLNVQGWPFYELHPTDVPFDWLTWEIIRLEPTQKPKTRTFNTLYYWILGEEPPPKAGYFTLKLPSANWVHCLPVNGEPAPRSTGSVSMPRQDIGGDL